MATIYKCDRCGDEINNRSDIGIVEYPLYHQGRFENLNDDRHSKDLCEKCARLLNEFLQNKK